MSRERGAKGGGPRAEGAVSGRAACGEPGFTLLELMVVMLLIAMLMAILLPAFAKMREKALIRKAETEVRALANAVRAFHHEYGFWPASPTGTAPLITTSTNLVFMRALAASDANPPGVNPLKINFIEIPGFTNSDPFRQAHAYRIRIEPTNNSVTVWSFGPDCVDGSGDEISAKY